MTTIIAELFQSASNGILPIYKYWNTFIPFVVFILWASVTDLKTMKIRNYQNLAFFLVGLTLWIVSILDLFHTGFTLGIGHFYGAIVGFLLLFIPGMILNTPMGGDIKFVTVMGFWIGPTAILLLLIFSSVIQLLILIGKSIKLKSFSMKNKFPFAPAFSLSFFILLLIFL